MKILDKTDVQKSHEIDEDRVYVDADIAQQLYDALVYALEDESRIKLPLKVQAKMVKAVKKADGDG